MPPLKIFKSCVTWSQLDIFIPILFIYFIHSLSFLSSFVICVIVLLGIAFPTCISVNHVVCHFSPLLSETDIPINDGDMVKM